MGNLPFLQSKRQFARDHFQEYYKEIIPAEYYSFHCSKGFKNSPQGQHKQDPLPEIMISPLYELALKKRGLKNIKKSVSDSSTYPYSCIGLLIVYFDDVLKCGTGSLIGKNLILTAASNIFDKETQKIATSLKFVLHLNGQKGHIFEISKDKIHFHQKFCQEIEGSHRYNYAFLEIDNSRNSCLKEEKQEEQQDKGLNDLASYPGLTHGYLGFNTDFRGMESVYVFGYSGEYNENGVEYKLKGEKIDALICKDSALGYKMESVSSEIGSPIMIKRKDIYEIVGIHMGGKKGLSCGLQFDEQVRGDLNSWVWQMQGSIDIKQKGLSAFQINFFSELDWHNMVSINLDNNNIASQGLQNLTKKAWPMLRELHLSNNNISTLSLEVSSIINIQKLYLNENDIKVITPLAELPLLTVLCIIANKVDSIDQLFGLKYLQRLDASQNRLKSIGSDIVKLTNLKKLYLSRNELTALPYQFLKMRSLKVIVVDRNKFKPIPTELFTRLELQHVQVILQ